MEKVLEFSHTLEGSPLKLHRLIPDDSPEVRYKTFVQFVSLEEIKYCRFEHPLKTTSTASSPQRQRIPNANNRDTTATVMDKSVDTFE